MADPRSHDELQRVWDAVLRGEPAAAGDLDPGLTETIRRLRARDRVPPPDPAFVRRLREDLMQGHGFASTIDGTVDLGRDLTAHPNGRAEPPPRPRPAVRLGGPRHRWALAQLATAAILLLTLVGAYAAYVALRPGADDGRRAAHPSLVASPTATLPAGATAEALAAATFAAAALPAGQGEVDLHRWTLAPGVTTTRPPGDFPTGVRVDYVVAGSYATRVDGPLLVARAGAIDAPESIAPGKEVRLGPGDAALYPQNDAGQTWGNAGTAPLELLVAGVFAAALPPPPAGLVAAELAQLLGQEAAWAPIATGPLALTLRRMSLAPGAELPPSAPPGPELVAVEAGVLGVAAVHAGSDAAAGRERFVVAGQGTALAPPAAGTLRVLRNADTSGRPLAFLVLTLAPAAGGAATPDA